MKWGRVFFFFFINIGYEVYLLGWGNKKMMSYGPWVCIKSGRGGGRDIHAFAFSSIIKDLLYIFQPVFIFILFHLF